MSRSVLALATAYLAWIGFGAGVATADPAAPDPAVTDPAPVQVVNAPLPVADPFTAASQQTKGDPTGALIDLLTGKGGSPAAPANPGVGLNAPPAVTSLAAVGSLLPQNYGMPSGDEASPYVLQTGVTPGPFARVDAFKGVHALLHGSLGRMPGSELGQPLPGTAPPPGTAIPAGIEQFLADPGPVEPAPPLVSPPGS